MSYFPANTGGDLGGSYPEPTVAKLNGIPLTFTAPADGEVLTYNSGGWVNSPAGVVATPPTRVTTGEYTVLPGDETLIIDQQLTHPYLSYTALNLPSASANSGRKIDISNPLGVVITSKDSNVGSQVRFAATIVGTTMTLFTELLHIEGFIGMVISGFNVTPGTTVLSHLSKTYASSGSTYLVSAASTSHNLMSGIILGKSINYPAISRNGTSIQSDGTNWIVTGEPVSLYTTNITSILTNTNQFSITYAGRAVWVYHGNGSANYLDRIDIEFNTVESLSPGGVGQNAQVGMLFDGTDLWIPQNPIILLNIATEVVTPTTLGFLPAALLLAGGFVWGNTGGIGVGSVHKIDPITKTIISSYSGAGSVTYYENGQGIAFDGANIYTCSQSTGIIHKIDGNTMLLIGAYHVGRGGCRALTFDGTNIWAFSSNQTISHSYVKIDQSVTQTLYTTGTIDVVAGVVTGTGVTFVPAMSGGTIILASGVSYFITAYISPTSLTVNIGNATANQFANNYELWYGNQDEYFLDPIGYVGIRSGTQMRAKFDGVNNIVLNQQDGILYVIDTTGAVINNIQPGVNLRHAFETNGKDIWLDGGSGTIERISYTSI